MSRLVGEVKLQTQCLKSGCKVRDSARTSKVNTPGLCVIPGSALADIYQQFGSRLLEGNVRSYLGTRGRINKMIRKTVATEPNLQRFCRQLHSVPRS